MDFENALMEDFASDSDASESFESPAIDRSQNSGSNQRPGAELSPESLRDLLQSSRMTSVDKKLQQLDALGVCSVPQLSRVHGLIPVIRKELEKYADSFETEYMDLLASIKQQSRSEEYSFLVELSDLPVLISDEIQLLQKHVALRYKVVFPELEQLVSNPVDYCRLVAEIGQDLAQIRAHEPRLRAIVAPEKVLTIVMAALQQYTRSFELSQSDLSSINAACAACVELSGFLQEVSQFISGKLSKYAPNVAEIVGPLATSQLLISTGSLSQLAQTPSCNLPSLGVRDLSSQHKTHSAQFARASGYLSQCPLVVGLPPEIVKQALRIISGKVVLAARIDLSRSSASGDMGRAYLREIQSKIDKLLTPPELASTKALPVPKEQKSKKRGGRRFRKMKERFQMSDLRKAQNKMSFGKQESFVVDGFGEEVGLGLSRQSASISVNRNTDARMSKAMIGRLQQQKERESLDTIILAPVNEKRAREQEAGSSWGTMKRQRVEENDEDEI